MFRARFGIKLHDFVMVLNTFTNFYRVRQKNVPGGSKITGCPQTSIKHCPENVGSAFNLSRAENKNPGNLR
jgi:hypothetical protein